MATLILTAVGTAIGGPLGGAIGAFVGRQADNAILGSRTVQGPRLKELSVTTSSYGQPIARNFGRMRVAGSIIWSTDLLETTSKEGGGKGQPSTRTYSYSASFAVALSSTPLDRIGRIWADGNLLRGAAGDLKTGGTMRVYLGEGDAPVDPLIFADHGAHAPAFRDFAYVVFEDLQLAEYGNRIPALTFEVFAKPDQSVSLTDLLPASAPSEGHGELEHAKGFSDEGGAVGSSLASIDSVFPLACVNTAAGLKITSEATLPSATPTLPEQISDRNSEEAAERFKRRGGGNDREPMAIRYYDEDRDYQPGIQRALGARSGGGERVLDLPAAMKAEGARQLANSNAHRARWRGEQIVWQTGELDPEVTAGSVVRLPDANGYWLVKSWEWFERGIEMGLERLAPELGVAAPSDAGATTPAQDAIITPTLLDAFEAPPDSTVSSSAPLLFAAASSSETGWKGASLFVEQGSTLVPIGTASKIRGVLGTTITDLAPSSSAVIECGASLDIEVAGSDLAFTSTDIVGLSAGQNRLLVGAEVVQFLHASQIDATQWRVSGLLRGRAGTESEAVSGQPSGTPIVLLDDSLTALEPSLVPSLGTTRIAAIGLGDSDPVYADLRNAGLSRRPPMPVWPRVRATENGSRELCWTRRGRGQWVWGETSEVPIVEEQELYLVGLGPSEAPLASWTTSSPRFSLTQPEIAALVSDHGKQTLWVRQVGTYLNSPPLLLSSIG